MTDRRVRLQWRLGAAILAAMLLTGCNAYERQLHHVAKDWCMTVRASQVLPVYPLTEDLQPGDVFLVTLPSNEQERLYKKWGFLPLDVQVARLDVTTNEFDQFYRTQYFEGDYASEGDGHERLVRDIAADGSTKAFAQSLNVPRACFPTYKVDVKQSGGFRAAFPIQSIPVGVSMLAASSATASVNLSDAYTYAGDPSDIERTLQAWARDPDNRKRLLDYTYGRPADKPLFLRVVQRVYLTGGVTVTISRTSQQAGGADVGAPQDVALLDPSDKSSIERFRESQEAIKGAFNEGLLAENAMPGASLRLAAASSRSVTLNEQFDRPLVIGYIAVDFEIRPDGTLGAALSTRDVLNGRSRYAAVRRDGLTGLDISISAIHADIDLRSSGNEEDKAQALAIIQSAVAAMPSGAVEYDDIRKELDAENPNVATLSKKLALADNTYRSSEGGEGPKTQRVYLALVGAFKAAKAR